MLRKSLHLSWFVASQNEPKSWKKYDCWSPKIWRVSVFVVFTFCVNDGFASVKPLLLRVPLSAMCSENSRLFLCFQDIVARKEWWPRKSQGLRFLHNSCPEVVRRKWCNEKTSNESCPEDAWRDSWNGVKPRASKSDGSGTQLVGGSLYCPELSGYCPELSRNSWRVQKVLVVQRSKVLMKI